MTSHKFTFFKTSPEKEELSLTQSSSSSNLFFVLLLLLLLLLSSSLGSYCDSWTVRENVSPTFFIVIPKRSGRGDWLAAVMPRSPFLFLDIHTHTQTKKTTQWKRIKPARGRRTKKRYLCVIRSRYFSWVAAVDDWAAPPWCSELHTRRWCCSLCLSDTDCCSHWGPLGSAANSLIGQYGTCPR